MQNSFSSQVNVVKECLNALTTAEFEVLINKACQKITDALVAGQPVLVCGNGGSAADAQHIAGELVGQFLLKRKALNVRALSVDSSILTAWSNDVSYATVFSRQVEAYGAPGGVLLAITTSGNSENVLQAAIAANHLGMSVISLTGDSGGAIKPLSDICLSVPSTHTPRVQEMHIMVYHYICEIVEREFL